jgi:hypothetical protein
MEQSNYILNTDFNNFIDHNGNKFENSTEIADYFSKFENFDMIIKSVNQKILRYKFLLNCKLLLIFLIDPEQNDSLGNSTISFNSQIKLAILLNDHFTKIPGNHKKLDSQFEFLLKKFEKIQNDWIRKNLSNIESRDVPSDDIELRRLREKNRLKEKHFFSYLHESDKKTFKKFSVELILNGSDLIKLKLSEKLRENRSDAIKQSIQQHKHNKIYFNSELNLQIAYIFNEIIIKPINSILKQLSKPFNLLIDSRYSKAFVYTYNMFNQSDPVNLLPYLITFDSFFQFFNRVLISFKRDQDEMDTLTEMRKEVLETPNRLKKISKKNDETNSYRVLKSEIVPRNTSHPRMAVKQLNEDPEKNFILIRNDHVQRVKNRLDASVSVLISKTISGTDSKRSHLEVLDFKQINKPDKCSVVGCPELPQKLLPSSKFKVQHKTF